MDRLVSQGRPLRMGLRYNLPATIPVANATLMDTGGEPCSLRISRESEADTEVPLPTETHRHAHLPQSWVWRPEDGAMPPLPKKHFFTETANPCP